MEMIRELADDEAAYRSLTLIMVRTIRHCSRPLSEIAEKKVKMIITTDHGTIRVKEPIKIIGDRSVNSNLRYKQGRNLNYDKRKYSKLKIPADAMLPRQHLSQAFVFARQDKFLCIPK
jgi:hypothetical protein